MVERGRLAKKEKWKRRETGKSVKKLRIHASSSLAFLEELTAVFAPVPPNEVVSLRFAPRKDRHGSRRM